MFLQEFAFEKWQWVIKQAPKSLQNENGMYLIKSEASFFINIFILMSLGS